MERSDLATGATTVTTVLGGVPETMLWTLYARACEARREGGILQDPQAIRILESIDYDFASRFGRPEPLFALRAALIDGVLRAWLRRYPDGVVVSLGEGLETQASRVDNGRMRWISLDLPEAMQVREQFIQPGGRFEHIAASATDPAWIDAIGRPAAVMTVAQGLFMYLDPPVVRQIMTDIATRLPGSHLVFDAVNKAFTEETQRGHQQTDTYRLPPMHWGVDRRRLVPTLREWGLPLASVQFLPYRSVSRRPPVVEAILDRIVPARGRLNSLVHVTFRG